jgi:cbb3-type cytochrome oxidase maturation protein
MEESLFTPACPGKGVAVFSNPDTVFIVAWVAFVILIGTAIAAVIFWAVRAGQFKDQDRARYLPLMSGIPKEPGEAEQNEEKHEQQ